MQPLWQPVPLDHHLHFKDVFLICSLNLPSFCLEPLPLVLCQQTLLKYFKCWKTTMKSPWSPLFCRLNSNFLSLSSEEKPEASPLHGKDYSGWQWGDSAPWHSLELTEVYPLQTETSEWTQEAFQCFSSSALCLSLQILAANSRCLKTLQNRNQPHLFCFQLSWNELF